MIGLDALNPYMLGIKIGLVVLAIATLFGLGIWVRGVFAERTELRGKLDLETQKSAMLTTQFNQYIQLNNDIAKAIKSIKIQSDTYIEGVENGKAPDVPVGGTPIEFIHGGMLQGSGVSSMPVYANYSACGASPDSAACKPVRSK